ncbi:MAG: phytanoyl-CoA dioxygenase family protein [Bacteroidota bacterium]|nr:phytanoyl-CoA dioxygenase family protein [Bacteroidota bacterium]
MREINYPKYELGLQLSKEQIDFFEDNGFLHFPNFITQEKVKEIHSEMDAIQKKWLADKVERINGVPIKFGADVDGSPIVQRFAFASIYSNVLHELLKDKRFEALFPLLGKKVQNARVGEYEKDGLVINHYINTVHSKFSQMGWHTDSLRDVFYGKKIMPMLNVGIHLDNFSYEKGGLRLIPGTHKQSLKELLFRKKYFLDYEPDPEEIGFDVKAGDLTVHDGRLWHRVAVSNVEGEESRRRVMYVPFITGKFKPRNEKSQPRLYQRFMYLLK